MGRSGLFLERPLAPYAVEDRCHALIGLVSLAAGFVLQAGGYVAFLAGAGIHGGLAPALGGLCLMLVFGGLVILVDRRATPRMRNRKLVEVARFDSATGTLRALPLAHLLRSYGEELGILRLDGEHDVAYCARVFQAEATTSADHGGVAKITPPHSNS